MPLVLTYAQIKEQVRQLLADRRANSFEFNDTDMQKSIDWACTELGRRLGFTLNEKIIDAVNGEVILPETIIKVIRVMSAVPVFPTTSRLIRGDVGPDGNIYGFIDSFSVGVINADTGVRTTFCGVPGSAGSGDGAGNVPRFNQLTDLKWGTDGNLYVLDTRPITESGYTMIKMISPTGDVTTVCNTGKGLEAFEVSQDTNTFYISYLSAIYTCTRSGVTTIFAGFTSGNQDGTGIAARFTSIRGLAFDSTYTNLVATDWAACVIRNITVPGAVCTTPAGPPNNSGDQDGTGASVLLQGPLGIRRKSDSLYYFDDNGNSKFKTVVPQTGLVTTVSGPYPENTTMIAASTAHVYVGTDHPMTDRIV